MHGLNTHNTYRYGFQGQERDDEVKGSGNSYDFGARMLDSRLGRWLSIDPMASDYPMFSDYCVTQNTPIQAVDPNGEYTIFVSGKRWTELKGTRWSNRVRPKGPAYWGGSRMTSYAMKMLGDDGGIEKHYEGGAGPGSVSLGRQLDGYNFAKENFDLDAIKAGVEKDGVLNIVGHSHGAAYAAGIAEYLAANEIAVDNIVFFAPSGPEFIDLSNVKADEVIQVGAYVDKAVMQDVEIDGVDRFGLVSNDYGGWNDWFEGHQIQAEKIGWNAVGDLLNMYNVVTGEGFNTSVKRVGYTREEFEKKFEGTYPPIPDYKWHIDTGGRYCTEFRETSVPTKTESDEE